LPQLLPPRVIKMFLNHLYGGMDEPGIKIIDVFMCKLCTKIANASDGKNYIETFWGAATYCANRARGSRVAEKNGNALVAMRNIDH
jgi:hypothetical protein